MKWLTLPVSAKARASASCSLPAAVIEPFALACLLQVYFKEIEGEVPNPDWAAKLESASGKFRKLGERAMQWAGGRHAPADGT